MVRASLIGAILANLLPALGVAFFLGGLRYHADFTRMSGFYFSFVTLATLGYGDIVPRSDVVRGFAIVEAVGGQLFLAVMVARLVSLYVNAEPKTKS